MSVGGLHALVQSIMGHQYSSTSPLKGPSKKSHCVGCQGKFSPEDIHQSLFEFQELCELLSIVPDMVPELSTNPDIEPYTCSSWMNSIVFFIRSS